MIDTKTIEGLYALRLPAMAAALADQRDQAAYAGSELRATPRAAGRQGAHRTRGPPGRPLPEGGQAAGPPRWSKTSTSAAKGAWTARWCSAWPGQIG